MDPFRSSPPLLAAQSTALLGVALAVLGFLVGCAPERAPELIEVATISPRLIELRSEVEITGSEFPYGRNAKVSLNGTVFAPGQAPRVLAWSATRRAESSTRLPLALGSPELEVLAGGAEHVTFRGELVVEFSPLRPDGPTLLGRLQDVELDIFSAGARANLSEDARAFQTYLAADVDAEFRVREVFVGGPAEQAGLTLGDRVTDLDGVHLMGSSDFVPRPHALRSRIQVEREGSLGELSLEVDRAEFESSTGGASSPLLCLVAGLLGLLVAARPPTLLRWVSFRRAVGADPQVSLSRLGQPGTWMGLLVALGLLNWASPGLLNWASPGAAARGIPSGLAPLFSLGLVLAISVWTISAGHRKSTGSWLSRTAALLSGFASLLPLLLGGVVLSFESGAFTSSGTFGLPGAWLLLGSPWLLFLGAGYLASLLGLASVRVPRRARHLLDFAVVVLSLFWVATFLGPSEEWSRVARAVYTAWGALLLSTALGAAARLLPATDGVNTLSFRLGLGLSGAGAAFYGLTWRFPSLRSFPGLEQATLTFAVVVSLATAWAGYRVFLRQGRAIDPWV